MSERFIHREHNELKHLLEKMNQIGREYRLITVFEKPTGDAGPRYIAIFEKIENGELSKVDESGGDEEEQIDTSH